MMRSLIIVAVVVALLLPQGVLAQACNPNEPNVCGEQTCDCIDTTSNPCTVGECTTIETVTYEEGRAAMEGRSFKSFVNDHLVPFVDNYVVRFLYAVAFLIFVFGIARGFFYGESEEHREEGKKFAVWGLISLVVLFGLWGIVRLLVGFLQG